MAHPTRYHPETIQNSGGSTSQQYAAVALAATTLILPHDSTSAPVRLMNADSSAPEVLVVANTMSVRLGRSSSPEMGSADVADGPTYRDATMYGTGSSWSASDDRTLPSGSTGGQCDMTALRRTSEDRDSQERVVSQVRVCALTWPRNHPIPLPVSQPLLLLRTGMCRQSQGSP
jgi:hypothetical protein